MLDVTSPELDWLIREGYLQGAYGPKVGWESRLGDVRQLQSQVAYLVERRQDQLRAPTRASLKTLTVLVPMAALIIALVSFLLGKPGIGVAWIVGAVLYAVYAYQTRKKEFY